MVIYAFTHSFDNTPFSLPERAENLSKPLFGFLREGDQHWFDFIFDLIRFFIHLIKEIIKYLFLLRLIISTSTCSVSWKDFLTIKRCLFSGLNKDLLNKSIHTQNKNIEIQKIEKEIILNYKLKYALK